MESCGSVEIEDCNHAAFVPTLAQSILLPDTYKWCAQHTNEQKKSAERKKKRSRIASPLASAQEDGTPR